MYKTSGQTCNYKIDNRGNEDAGDRKKWKKWLQDSIEPLLWRLKNPMLNRKEEWTIEYCCKNEPRICRRETMGNKTIKDRQYHIIITRNLEN